MEREGWRGRERGRDKRKDGEKGGRGRDGEGGVEREGKG